MLDAFAQNVGPERMDVPAARGMIVLPDRHTRLDRRARGAVLDEERPLIAGVYQNRTGPRRSRELGLLQSDPTIFYIHDTLELAKVPVAGVGQLRLLGPAQGRADRRCRSHPSSLGTTPTRARAFRLDRSPRRRTARSTPRSSRTPRTATSTSWPRATAARRRRSPRRSRSTEANVKKYMQPE